MRKGTKAWLRNLLYYPMMAFCCLEIALRILGYESFQNEDYSVKSSPENAFVGDSVLGIRLNAGEYRTTVNDGLTFGATHLAIKVNARIKWYNIDIMPQHKEIIDSTIEEFLGKLEKN